MPNFKIASRSTVAIWVALALGLTAVLVVCFNRPVRRVSLPKGTKFPACLFELDPNFHTCDESTTCVREAPGGLTYSKGHRPAGGEGKNWCCPDGTSPQEEGGVIICIVD